MIIIHGFIQWFLNRKIKETCASADKVGQNQSHVRTS